MSSAVCSVTARRDGAGVQCDQSLDDVCGDDASASWRRRSISGVTGVRCAHGWFGAGQGDPVDAGVDLGAAKE